MASFDSFFRQATGKPPYGYQVRIARDGLPAAVEAPTGTGKTGVILAWLWRWLHDPGPAVTPRRLVYALPQRTLVEQVAAQAGRWVENLGVAGRVALHVVMGGEGRTQTQWRLDMHRPAIVVGTVDSLVSKALNRGYGIARAIYPIDFALVTNGAHWVVDEVQLCPESTTTLRQLAAFTAGFGTAEPFGLTCMSATIPQDLLDTVDNPAPTNCQITRIEPEERAGELAVRLNASRLVRRLDAVPGDYAAVAAAAQARHRPGSLTLVVVNTVGAARETAKAVQRLGVPATLLPQGHLATERHHPSLRRSRTDQAPTATCPRPWCRQATAVIASPCVLGQCDHGCSRGRGHGQYRCAFASGRVRNPRVLQLGREAVLLLQPG